MLVQYGEVGDTLYFGYVGNNTSGSANDGTSPLWDVRLAGAAASAAPVLSGSGTLLTHVNYGPGCTEIAVAATTGNGFADGNTYLVYATETNDGQTPGSLVGLFSLGKLQTAADSGLLEETTIATLASQTSFTLTDGSDQNGEYVNLMCYIEDADNVRRRAPVEITAYTGVSKTVTLAAGTATFTAAIGDVVRIYAQWYRPPANITQISDDATAAANAEAFFDGTGYAGTNNVIPTVTTLTGHTAQTGDSYAVVAAQNDLSAAQVNAEVVDALNTDTYAEPGQATPGATVSLVDKIGYLYKAWRNKTELTSSEYRLFNDDASTVDQKASVIDSGSVITTGEKATGP